MCIQDDISSISSTLLHNSKSVRRCLSEENFDDQIQNRMNMCSPDLSSLPNERIMERFLASTPVPTSEESQRCESLSPVDMRSESNFPIAVSVSGDESNTSFVTATPSAKSRHSSSNSSFCDEDTPQFGTRRPRRCISNSSFLSANESLQSISNSSFATAVNQEVLSHLKVKFNITKYIE